MSHSDAGSQFTSVRCGERLADIGAVPSIGSVGDSHDTALAESVNSLYKTELIYGLDQGTWKTITDVEIATLSWVHWFNTQRPHGHLGDSSPADHEAAYDAERSNNLPVGHHWNSSPSNPGCSTEESRGVSLAHGRPGLSGPRDE